MLDLPEDMSQMLEAAARWSIVPAMTNQDDLDTLTQARNGAAARLARFTSPKCQLAPEVFLLSEPVSIRTASFSMAFPNPILTDQAHDDGARKSASGPKPRA